MGGNHSLPIRKKRLEKGQYGNLYYVSCAMQGWRPSMEDRFANYIDAKKGRKFFGVFDGHAGAHTASQLSEYLHFLISENTDYRNGNLLNAIEKGFIEMDNKLADDQKTQVDISGSTGILLLVDEHNKIFAAGLGDSRAVISHQGRAQHLSKDHLPNDPQEYQRIRASGGFVANERVNGSLAMSRAFGDFIFKQNTELALEDQGVCCRPDIRHRILDFKNDEFMVIGSDGIWEVLSEQEVVDFVRTRLAKKIPLETIAMDLLDNCITDDVMNVEGIGCDNMTCSIICLHEENSNNKENINVNLTDDINNNHQPATNPQTQKLIIKKTAQYMVDNTSSSYKSRNPSNSSNSENNLKNKNHSSLKHNSKFSKGSQPANDYHFPSDFIADLSYKCAKSMISTEKLPALYLNHSSDPITNEQ